MCLEDGGQDLVEYSLLLVLISLATVAVVDSFGDAVEDTFVRVIAVLFHVFVGG